MSTAILFFHFVLPSVHFGCIWRCSFSSSKGVVHRNSPNLCQRKQIQVSNILVSFPEILVFFDIKASVFCCFRLSKNQKPLGTRLRYITNVFHWSFSKGILKKNFIRISVSNFNVIKVSPQNFFYNNLWIKHFKVTLIY